MIRQPNAPINCTYGWLSAVEYRGEALRSITFIMAVARFEYCRDVRRSTNGTLKNLEHSPSGQLVSARSAISAATRLAGWSQCSRPGGSSFVPTWVQTDEVQESVSSKILAFMEPDETEQRMKCNVHVRCNYKSARQRPVRFFFGIWQSLVKTI